MKEELLIVDDEAPMRHLLSLYLRQQGYLIEEASSGNEAISKIQNKNYHLILLDVMMPDLDGWETCEKIRQISSVPILMLTARDEVRDKVKGLKLGADDYITKPFDKEELLARIEASIRRGSLSISKEEQTNANIIAHRGIVFDIDKHQVKYNNQILNLTPKEYEMLQTMTKKPGRVYSREDLLSIVWSNEEIEDDRTVDAHVKNIREKLKKAGAPAHDILKTVWGVGYKVQ